MAGNKFSPCQLNAFASQSCLPVRYISQNQRENTDENGSKSRNGTIVGFQKPYDTPEEIAHNTKHRSPLIPWGFFSRFRFRPDYWVVSRAGLAMNKSASLNRRSENVVVAAVVIPKLELGNRHKG
jgi:hypothetical protein